MTNKEQRALVGKMLRAAKSDGREAAQAILDATTLNDTEKSIIVCIFKDRAILIGLIPDWDFIRRQEHATKRYWGIENG